MIAGVHGAPAEMQSMDVPTADATFRVGRVAQSTLAVDTASSEGTASEDEPAMSPRDWQGLHEALAATVERLIASHAEGKEEDHRGPGPVVVPASAVRVVEIDPAAPGVLAAEGGLAAAPEPHTDVGRQDTPPAITKANSFSEQPTLQAPRPVARSAAAFTPESASEDEGDVSLHFTSTPGDIPRAGGSERRESTSSRMSTLMKGLRAISLPGMSGTPGGLKTAGAQEEGHAQSAPPQPSGTSGPAPLAEPQSSPRVVGRALMMSHIGTEDTTQAVRSELQSSMQAWQRRRAEQSRHTGSRHGDRRPRAKRKKSFGEKYLKRMKLVSTLSREGMSPEAFRQLPADMRVAVWQRSNETMYGLIMDSLGHKYRHLMGRVAEGDGLGAYNAILLLDNEHTAGAKNQYLTELMGLRMEDTGTSSNPACILTYYERLHELDAKYSRANNGVGVGTDILRTKLMELPQAYSFAVHCMEQDDIAARRDGREQMSCQGIVDYVRFFENSVKRKAKAGRRRSGGHAKARPKQRPRGRAYWANDKAPRGAGRRPNSGGGNPLRHMRGRAARMAMQRARSGKRPLNDKSKIRCYACGELGHYKRECPNVKGQPRGGRPNSTPPTRRAYNVTSQPKYKQAPGRGAPGGKLSHVAFVLRVVSSQGETPQRALRAQDTQQNLVLDSGATGHFVPGSTELERKRPTTKSVAGAGGEVMRGLAEGSLGSLRNVLQVEGLNQGLVSVCQLAHSHSVCVVFTKRGACLLPQRVLQRFMTDTPLVAEFRRETGLYHTTPRHIEEALTKARAVPRARRTLHAENGSASSRPSERMRANVASTTEVASRKRSTTPVGGGAAEGSAMGNGRPSLRRSTSMPTRAAWKATQASGESRCLEGVLGMPEMRRARTYTGPGVEPKRRRLSSKAEIAKMAYSVPLPPDPKRGNMTAGEKEALCLFEPRGWSQEVVRGGAQLARRIASDPHGSSTADTQRQVLILACTGDMALAHIVADAYGIDWDSVVAEKNANRYRYALLAASTTLLTCDHCMLPAWPDCDCQPNAVWRGSAPQCRSYLMEKAYNYMDKPMMRENPALLFHKRMGHLSRERLLKAFKDGGDHGIKGLTEKLIKELPWCADCAATKQTRKGHPRQAKNRKRSTQLNAVVHTDTMERVIYGMPPGNYRKTQVFVDECSRYIWVRFLRTKNAAEFTEMLQDFERAAQIQHRSSHQYKGTGPGCPVLSYFSDNASELISRKQKRRLAEKLIDLRLSTPGESQANGIAERANRLVLEMTRVLLYQAGLPLPFWPPATEMAAYLLNRSPSATNGGKSPYEAYFGKPPDRSKIRRFGCKCWVWQDKGSRPNRSKLDATASPMIFMGYTDTGTQGLKVYDPVTRKIKVRYSLLFAEDENVGLLHVPRDTFRRIAINVSRMNREDARARAAQAEPKLAIDSAAADDGWSRVYVMSDEESLLDVSRRIGVDAHEIQAKNVGLSGADPKTGLVPVDAPLEGGTEIWVPSHVQTDAARPDEGEPTVPDVESNEAVEARPEPDGVEPGEITADERVAVEAMSQLRGPETTPDIEARQESKASEESSWTGRLRTRRRKALTVEYDRPIEVIRSGKVGRATAPTPQGKHRAMLLRTQRDIEDLLKGDDDVPALKMMLAVAEQEVGAGSIQPDASHEIEDLIGFGQMTADKRDLENQWLYANSAKSAAKHNRTDCLSWILDRGVDIETTTKSGNTLLHLAAFHGNEATCQMLLARGSALDATNSRGEEAWQSADTNGSKRCAELIRAWPNLNEGQLLDLEDESPSQGESGYGPLEGALVLTKREKAQLEAAAHAGAERALRIRPPGVSAEHSTYRGAIIVKSGDDSDQAPRAKPTSIVPIYDAVALPETDRLLTGVLAKAKLAIQIQAKQSLLGRERMRVDELCNDAHNDFARAYMIEHMLLVESLKGVMARDIPTPKNYKEAVNSEFADYWNEAIMTEIRNLESFNTWEWVPRPKDRKLVDSTWVFRAKANQKGEVDRMKARLCARGYRQIWGQDYVETHAPVTCLASWRASLAQAAHHGRKIAILDIKSAYLMADVKEDIYMSCPQGLTPPRPGYVIKLKRSLYGLKQAGRCWAQLLSKKMQELGLRPSVADPCLFLNDVGDLNGPSESPMTISVHVDDCCICYSSEQTYQDFRRRLEKEFQISKSDDSNTFLGMVIERPDGDAGPVHVHQQPYLADILARYRHTDVKPASTPMEPGLKLSKSQMPTTESEKAAMKDIPYRQLVGALLYLANCTRPDIAQAVSSCARFGSNPGRVHWQALKHVLRYLKGTKEYGITFGLDRADGVPHTCIHGYVDGDWGGDPDDRRSTTGYIYMSYGGPVCWRSKKQASTALSSCESEYMAASEAAKEAIWLTRLYKEDFCIEDISLETKGDLTEKEYLGNKPLTVFEDNVGCISLSKNPVMHRSSKHIEIRYHFVRERVQDGSLKLVYIPSSENIADVLTKSTRKHTFTYLRDKFMHNPHWAPGKALIAELNNHFEVARPLLRRPRKIKPAGLSHAEEDFLGAMEAHALSKVSYITWEGELQVWDGLTDDELEPVD